MRNKRINLLFFLFFISGFTGLLYEIVWLKLLRLVFGNTTFALSTVVTSFMAGLALGSYIGGKIADKTQYPLRLYGILEGTIGVYALFSPLFLTPTFFIYRVIYPVSFHSFYLFNLIRFFVCFIFLLLPTTFMGMSLPLLSKYCIRNNAEIGKRVGTLYGINTFGAVLGVAVSTFLLLPLLGIWRTILSGFFLNLFILLLVFKTFWKSPVAKFEEQVIPLKKNQQGLLLFIIFLSGITAMLYEIVWTKVIILSIGSSTYAFGIVLIAFIFGIASGSIFFSKISEKKIDLFFILSIIQIGIGVASIIISIFFTHLPFYIISIVNRFYSSFILLIAVEFLLILLFIFPPTFLFGGMISLISKLYTKNIKFVGKSIGNVYASNTMGNIVGSLGAGFIFVPFFGLQKSIVLAIAINLSLGIVFIIMSSLKRWKKVYGFSFILFEFMLAISLPQWNRKILSSGPFRYGLNYKKIALEKNISIKRNIEQDVLLYYKEGAEGVVSVHKSPFSGKISLRINGKVDAGTDIDLTTQFLTGYIPFIYKPNTKEILVIGLGSGITCGAISNFPVKKIECVEISKEVTEAARYFDTYNQYIFKNPKFNLIIDDARSYLTFTQKKYDMIVSEPSNPWIDGISSLYTKEFLIIIKKRLKEKGIFAQWLPVYSISPKDVKIILHTFSSEFPYVSVWSMKQSNYLLIGSNQPLRIDFSNIFNLFINEKIRTDLESIKIKDPYHFVSHFIFNKNKIEKVASNFPFLTDDKLSVEYSAPKYLYVSDMPLLEEFFLNYKESVIPYVINLSKEEKEIIKDIEKAEKYIISASIALDKGKKKEALFTLKLAIKYDPYHPFIIEFLSDNKFLQARAAQKKGDLQSFEKNLKESIEINPKNIKARFALATFCFENKRFEEAKQQYKKIIQIQPNIEAYNTLGIIYLKEKKLNLAKEMFLSAIKMGPFYPKPYYNLALVYTQENDINNAKQCYLKVIRLEPENFQARVNLGNIYRNEGNIKKAIKQFKKSIKIMPHYLTYYNLGLTYEQINKTKKAKKYFKKSYQLNPNFIETRKKILGY